MTAASSPNNNNNSNKSDDNVIVDEVRLQMMVTENQRRQQQGGWTFSLLYSVAASLLGTSFMYGYNSSVVNESYDVISQFVNESYHLQHGGDYLTEHELTTHWSVVVSLFLFGGAIGSVWIPEAMANRYGRTRSLLYISPIGAIGGFLSFVAPYTNSFAPLLAGRALVGFHSGLVMVIIPALLVELPPVHLRGACGAFNELTLVIGVVFANLVALRYLFGTEQLWIYLFLLATIIYLLHTAMLIFAAESPRWLVDKKRDKDAQDVIRKLRGTNKTTVLAEFQETKEISHAEAAIQRVSIVDFFKTRQLWWPLLLSINLHLTQQLTGIAAVSYYSSEVMIKAGLDEDSSKLANFGVSFVDIFATLFSSLIVDRVGRRILMILGLGGMALAHTFTTIVLVYNQYYVCIAAFGLVMFTFSLGPGPITWFMTAEMFQQGARPLALSICLFFNWVANLVVGIAFPQMRNHIGEYAFLPFAIVSFLEMILMFFFLPETNGISVEDVVAKFASDQPLFQFTSKNRRRRPTAKQSPKTSQSQEMTTAAAVNQQPGASTTLLDADAAANNETTPTRRFVHHDNGEDDNEQITSF